MLVPANFTLSICYQENIPHCVMCGAMEYCVGKCSPEEAHLMQDSAIPRPEKRLMQV